MSQEKNATDDPPRSPPDQGGAVNRSFSIHEIQDMSDDDADGYRAALDERAARRARRCALSAPQAAEAPAHPTAARSPDQPAPTPSGSGNAVSSRRGQHRAIEDGTAGLKPAPTSTGDTTPIEDGTAAESAPTSTDKPEDGTAAEPAPTSTAAEPEPEADSGSNQDADVKIVEEPRTPPGRGDTTEADFNLARANLSATLASHEKAGVTVFRPANTTVRMDDGTDVIVPAGPTVLSEIAAQRRQHTAGFRGNGVVPSCAHTPPCNVRHTYTVCTLTGRGVHVHTPLPVMCAIHIQSVPALAANARDGAQCPNDPGSFPHRGTNVPSRV